MEWLEAREQCVALVQGSAWARLDGDLQCSRRVPQHRARLGGIPLCGQHVNAAKRYGALELTEGRTLILERERSEEEPRLEIVTARVVTNVSHLQRVERGSVTHDQLATQLAVRLCGSPPMPQLVAHLAANDTLMRIAARDMDQAARIMAATVGRKVDPQAENRE
jgi:hypothetical protein